jgi:hypothetical protein
LSIVVCDPTLNTVRPASVKLPAPSADWPSPTVSVPVPRRIPKLAKRNAAVLPSSSKSSSPISPSSVIPAA